MEGEEPAQPWRQPSFSTVSVSSSPSRTLAPASACPFLSSHVASAISWRRAAAALEARYARRRLARNPERGQQVREMVDFARRVADLPVGEWAEVITAVLGPPPVKQPLILEDVDFKVIESGR